MEHLYWLEVLITNLTWPPRQSRFSSIVMTIAWKDGQTTQDCTLCQTTKQHQPAHLRLTLPTRSSQSSAIVSNTLSSFGPLSCTHRIHLSGQMSLVTNVWNSLVILYLIWFASIIFLRDTPTKTLNGSQSTK